MILSLTITRPILSLADLVVTNNPFGASLYLPEDGLSEVEGDFRREYLPDSRDMHGKELIAAVLDQGELPVTVYAQGTSAAELATNKAIWRDALGQWSYSVTLNLDGATATYTADPCRPQWGRVDSGMVAQHLARSEVTIPVYPIPA